MKRKLTALIAIALMVTMFAAPVLADMVLFDADLTVGYNEKYYGDYTKWYKDDDSRAWLSILLYLDLFGAEVMETTELLQYDIANSYIGYAEENGIMVVLYPGKTDVLVAMYTPAKGTAGWGILSIGADDASMSTSMNAVCTEYVKISPLSYNTIWSDLTDGD